MPLFITLLLTTATVAGCINDSDDGDEADSSEVPVIDAFGRTVTRVDLGNGTAVVSAAMGAISEVRAEGGGVVVGLPLNAWVLDEGRLSWGMNPLVALDDGDTLEFLVPTATQTIELGLTQGGASASRSFAIPSLPTSVTEWSQDLDFSADEIYAVPSPWHPDAALVNGMEVIELMEVQEERFPHRTPGMPNYEASQDYFVEYLRNLGYEIVVKDEFGMNALPQPDGGPLGIKPQSLANVYAYRPGTGTPDRIVGFGGHYDMVENTKHAAFDDTSGTIMTLMMAKAFSEIETDVGLLFGLWGGEEDGILGSSFFAKTHPDIVAQMVLYINFDVAALAWPGPALNPDPVIISPGPDGPVADSLTAQAQRIMSAYVPEMPQELQIYEDIVEGQAGGEGGVNAQSDHTSFMQEGVPVYFPFTGNVSTVFALFHSPRDTLHNLTHYMATQQPIAGDDEEPEMTPEEFELGRRLLARSMETFMGFALYQTLEIDQGLYSPPGRPSG